MAGRASSASDLRHNLNFQLFWVGETTSRIGTAVTSVALPLVAVTVLNANPFLVGLLASGVWLPWLLVGLPAGAWVDRLPKRPLMLICNVASMLLLVSVPIAFWFGVLTIWQLIFVALAAGVVGVFFLNAYQVFLSLIVQREYLGPANARVQGSEAAARIAGPGLGGWLAQAFGAVTGVLVDVVTFAVSVLCLFRIRFTEPTSPRASRDTRVGQEIRAGLRYVNGNLYLRLIAVYAAACNFAEGALQAVVIVFAVRVVGADAGTVGTLIAIAGLGGVLGAVASSRIVRALGNARTLVWAGVCTAPFALLIPLTSKGPGLALFVVGMLISDIGLIVSNVVIDSFRQSYCRRDILGRVVSSTRCLTYGAGALGALAGGTIADQFGARTGVWTATIAQVLCVAIVLTGPIRNRRDLPAGHDGQ